MSTRPTMRRIHSASHGTMNELNITPLLDLVFVLLVIFIITTPQLVNNLEINLPSGKPPAPNPNAPKPKINHLSVDAKGTIFLNREVFTLDGLKKKLTAMKKEDPELGVVVEGAEEVDYQHMVGVLDVLQQLDISKVGLATEPVESTAN